MELFKESLGKVAVTVSKGYWSKDKHYDRLTIVEVAHEYRTYISRKPVPGGIDILNRDYWIPFSSLREEITEDYKGMKRIADAIQQWNNQLNAKINLLNSKLNVFIQSSNWADQEVEDRLDIIDKLIEALNNTWRVGRPELTAEDIGTPSFDTELNIPIWWDGEKWISSKGVDVTTYFVADSILNTLDPPSPRYNTYIVQGYIVLLNGGIIAVMNNISALDGGWALTIEEDSSRVYVVKSNMHMYRVNNGNWEDLGTF